VRVKMRQRFLFLLIFTIILSPGLLPFLAAADYFNVTQTHNRWWFLDPDGQRFFSTGVNVVSPGGHYCPDLGTSPYHDNIMALYGSEEAWAEVTLARLREWNFNTLGGWSSFGLFEGEMAYTTILYLSGADWQYGIVPDYWSDEFYERVETNTEACYEHADDPWLVGYFIDNEMRWGPDWRRVADLFADYLGFSADSPGKLVLQDWLMDRYDGDLDAFNEVYGLDLQNWEDLQNVLEVSPMPVGDQQLADRREWTRFVADHFFAVTTAAIREKDPNHLIMGARFVSWVTPRRVVEAAAPYLDVLSINHYMIWPVFEFLQGYLADAMEIVDPSDMLVEYYEITGLPILITEFAFRGLDAVPPSTWPPPWFFTTADTQRERAAWTVDYVRECIRSRYCVGYHWFDYMDEPALGRFDGEDSNFGLVSEEDVPYDHLVHAFQKVNLEVFSRPY